MHVNYNNNGVMVVMYTLLSDYLSHFVTPLLYTYFNQRAQEKLLHFHFDFTPASHFVHTFVLPLS